MADQPNRLTWRRVAVAAVLIWLSVSILFSSAFVLAGRGEPEEVAVVVAIVFGWMALVVLFGLIYCGLMAGAVWSVTRLGRLLHICD